MYGHPIVKGMYARPIIRNTAHPYTCWLGYLAGGHAGEGEAIFTTLLSETSSGASF